MKNLSYFGGIGRFLTVNKLFGAFGGWDGRFLTISKKKPLEDGVGSGLPVGVLSLAAQWGGASGRASNWWSFSPFSPIIVVIIFVNIL